MDAPHPPRKKRTKSELLRVASLHEFVEAHAKPNGHGWRGFVRSNLFGVLLLFLLSQLVVIAGLLIANYYKTSELSEWKGRTDAIITRMDKDGTMHSQWRWEESSKDRTELRTRIDKLEEITKRVPVMESENRRLTQDVEELRHGKK